jgi:hypothetical protein
LKPKLKLHIGKPRTGSTAVQDALNSFRADGRSCAGWDLLDCRLFENSHSKGQILPNPDYGNLSLGYPANLSLLFAMFQLEANPQTIGTVRDFAQMLSRENRFGVASAEYFWEEPEKIKQFQLDDFFELSLYVMLRNPLSQLEASVKHFYVPNFPGDLDAFVETMAHEPSDSMHFQRLAELIATGTQINLYCFECPGSVGSIASDLVSSEKIRNYIVKDVNKSAPAWFAAALDIYHRQNHLVPAYGATHLWTAVRGSDLNSLGLFVRNFVGPTSLLTRSQFENLVMKFRSESRLIDQATGGHTLVHLEREINRYQTIKFRDEIPIDVLSQAVEVLSKLPTDYFREG